MTTRHPITDLLKEYIVPIDNWRNHITDCTYFLRNDGVFVFAEGYWHPENSILGNILYYPSDNGHNDYAGLRYASMNKVMVNGELQRVGHDIQYDNHFKFFPELKKNGVPFFAEYRVSFPIDSFVGLFEHKNSLRQVCSAAPEVDEAISRVERHFNIPRTRLGVTGSLSFGVFDDNHDDVDLVFYGSPEENKKIISMIDELVKIPENRVFEFGRYWPIRFFLGGTMICSFFCYSDRKMSPLHDFSMDLIEDNIEGRGRVADDTHGFYMPPVLLLEDVTLAGKKYDTMELVIYNGLVRGEYRNGDILSFKGKSIELQTTNNDMTKSRKAALVTIWSDIKREN
ncbi:MAG: hypothetical protein CVV64_08055 [Candidatus Wallbacteria bacterium HGW-Wallbacteria-1]|jgi:predicted nucleotidyltransferase|uniref:Polymerase nucleotidyl transferase domain-containing protein n=1 Tax=Candidatus Wallbacteria bacterium HGW-Wallbacteria-1 TaxID=2013854 RepID=A0A2N1PR59_9BACT|nr:MAG: hypothetical protein CVV64_08055 [Candidatus Wallbacteria bacterium HGW-Wallbacteria-1]